MVLKKQPAQLNKKIEKKSSNRLSQFQKKTKENQIAALQAQVEVLQQQLHALKITKILMKLHFLRGQIRVLQH